MNLFKKVIAFIFLLILCVPVYGASNEECSISHKVKDLLDVMGEDDVLVDLIKANGSEIFDRYEKAKNNIDVSRFDGVALRVLLEIPAINNGFEKWFDTTITAEQLDAMWANPKVKAALEKKIRHPSSEHEWLMVSRLPDLKRFGFTFDDIRTIRTKTADLQWTIPELHANGSENSDRGDPGSHGNQTDDGDGRGSGQGSGRFHNELGKILDDLLASSGQNKAVFMASFEIQLTGLLDRWKVVERETILENLF